MNHSLAVIIVTHNSEDVIDLCIDALDLQQVLPDQIIIVDSGSEDPSYLAPYQQKHNCQIHYRENIGFSAANNTGLGFVDESIAYVLFINPDTFLDDGCLLSGLEILHRNSQTAILTGVLKGYDLTKRYPSGLLDSTGVFRTWYGRWYDRGQGEKDSGQYDTEQQVPAVCGAFMLCRKRAVDSVIDQKCELFDESFFMYKEDIDLSLRMRKKNWTLLYSPKISAYHARGWSRDRKKIPYNTRTMASINEIRLNIKHRSPYLIWSVGKYLAVRVFRI